MGKRLIIIGGIFGILWTAFHLFLYKILDWPETLTNLSEINRGTIYVLNNHVALTILFFAVVSLLFSSDLVTTRLGRITTTLIGIFYALRAVEQFLFYQTITAIGIGVIVSTSLLALIYWMPLFLVRQS